MNLSVIIPTRNRAKLLLRTLDAIAKVEFPQSAFEVIVADTDSTDSTQAECKEFSGRKSIRNFRYERCDRPGLHVGRHKGAQVADAEILVYADDDIIPDSTWLDAISESFSDPTVVLVGGNNLPDYETTPPDWVQHLWRENEWGRYNGHYSLIDFGTKGKTIPADYVYGCNFSIRKSVLMEAGGFHPDGMPKELLRYRGDGESSVSWALDRAGKKAVFHPEASVRHWVPASRMKPEYLSHRGYIQGISASYTEVRVKGEPSSFNPIRRFLGDSKRRLVYYMKRAEPPTWLLKRFVEGFRFHQDEVRRDPLLLQWVLKKDYWDEASSPKLMQQI